MEFASKRIEAEFDGDTHPDLKRMLGEIDRYIQSAYQKPCFVTCLRRTQEENTKAGGVRGSWHLFGCGADIRTRHLLDHERRRLENHCHELIDRDGRERWEIVTKLHGTGAHIHIARRDAAWRDKSP